MPSYKYDKIAGPFIAGGKYHIFGVLTDIYEVSTFFSVVIFHDI